MTSNSATAAPSNTSNSATSAPSITSNTSNTLVYLLLSNLIFDCILLVVYSYVLYTTVSASNDTGCYNPYEWAICSIVPIIFLTLEIYISYYSSTTSILFKSLFLLSLLILVSWREIIFFMNIETCKQKYSVNFTNLYYYNNIMGITHTIVLVVLLVYLFIRGNRQQEYSAINVRAN